MYTYEYILIFLIHKTETLHNFHNFFINFHSQTQKFRKEFGLKKVSETVMKELFYNNNEKRYVSFYFHIKEESMLKSEYCSNGSPTVDL